MGNHDSLTRLSRISRAARCSYRGMRRALLQERAFQEELLVLLLVVIPGAVFLGQSSMERVLMVGSWLNVMIVELLNTSLEVAVDRISTEQHPLSGQAKDLGSAAVLVSIGLAATVWGMILFA